MTSKKQSHMAPQKSDVHAIAADEAEQRGGVTPAEVMRDKGLLQLVLVRTFGEGVHVGLLAFREGMECELLDCRRVWRWRGANTLNEVVLHGVSMTEFTRLSEPVPSVILTTVIGLYPVSEKARESLTVSRWL